MNETSILKKILAQPSLKITEVLDENGQIGLISFVGEVKTEEGKVEQFILKIKQKPFKRDDLNLLFAKIRDSNIDGYFNNDIYFKYLINNCLTSINIDIELVYPANEDVIIKNRKPILEIISETKEMYEQRTIPFLDSLNPKSINWINNIIYKEAEVPLFKNESFVLLKNYTTANENNYLDCIGIPYKKEGEEIIRSLRDLNQNHLPLLELFYSQGVRIYYIDVSLCLETRIGQDI